MQVDVGTLGFVLALILPLLGGLIWLVRLEGRVNLLESRVNDFHNDIAEIKKGQEVMATDIKTLLQRSFGARAGDKS